MNNSISETTEKKDLPYNKSCIVIPTYNEKENAQQMIETIFRLYPEISLLFIDDGSPDGTSDVIESLQKKIYKSAHNKKKRKVRAGHRLCCRFSKSN